MKDYRLTEEEYFEYYQNSCDPTFQFYPFPEMEDIEIGKEVSLDNIPEDLDDFLKKNSGEKNSDKNIF